MLTSLNNISPLDGRYANNVKELSVIFSEKALIQYRLKIEIEYLIALGDEKGVTDLEPFSKTEHIRLRKIYESFDLKDAEENKKN